MATNRDGRSDPGTFRSLGVRNFRLWFVGQCVSLTGFRMQVIATAVLVLNRTDSGTVLGLATALQFLPIFIVGPFAGVLCDRVDKRKLALATQSTMMMLAFVLGLLVLTDQVTIAWIFVLAGASGTAWSIDQPARNTIVVELVSEADRSNAVSLNASTSQGSKVVGPALAGALVTVVDVGWVFIINGLTSLAVVGALLLMDPREIDKPETVKRTRGQIRAGFTYAWGNPVIRVVLGILGATSLLCYEWAVLLPLFVTRDLGGGVGAFATLFAVLSMGALAGTLCLARREVLVPHNLGSMCLGLAASSIALAAAPTVTTAALAAFFVGASGMGLVNGGVVVLQLRASAQMRGRVMASFSLVVVGVHALGASLAGALAEGFGARATLAMAGCLAFVIWAVTTPTLKRVAAYPHQSIAKNGGHEQVVPALSVAAATTSS